MKIIHIINSLEIGGAQRLLADVLPIQQKDNDVELVVLKDIEPSFKDIIERVGIKINNIDCNNYYAPWNACKLKKYINGADIVHVHLFPSIYWVALASLLCRNIKLIYTEHSTHNKRRNKAFLRPLERCVYNRYKKIISISPQTQENLMTWLKVKPFDSRFVVIENGVNIKKFSLPSIKIYNNRLIMVSRFAEMKDQETVIRSMAFVKKDAELYLVGDGPNRVRCEQVAFEIGVADRVHFLGSQSDIPELIAQSYIGIQSSLWEGFGLTAVEIMAAGKPVIATTVDGLKQVVEGAGLLFDVRDEKMLASYINDLLENNVLYNEVAEKCRKRAQCYDIQKMDQRYKDIYNEVLSV